MDGLVHFGLNSCYLPFQDSIGYSLTGVKSIKSTQAKLILYNELLKIAYLFINCIVLYINLEYK